MVFGSQLPDNVVGALVLWCFGALVLRCFGALVLANFSNQDTQILCAFRYTWPLLPMHRQPVREVCESKMPDGWFENG